MEPKDMDFSRRTFLHAVGAGVPTLTLLLNDSQPASGPAAGMAAPVGVAKFTPLDLSTSFNCSARDFGSREPAKGLGGDSARDGLVRVPASKQSLQGIPFLLGPEEVDKKSWLALSTQAKGWATGSKAIPIGKAAGFVCLATFCDWDAMETPGLGETAAEKVGQKLADAVLVYEDGSEQILPLRRRFEVNAPSIVWGHQSFAALPHRQDAATKLTDPLPDGTGWGELQTSLFDGAITRNNLG